MAGSGWKLLEWLEMAMHGWKQLEMAGNGWEWLEIAEMAGNCSKGLEIAGMAQDGAAQFSAKQCSACHTSLE